MSLSFSSFLQLIFLFTFYLVPVFPSLTFNKYLSFEEISFPLSSLYFSSLFPFSSSLSHFTLPNLFYPLQNSFPLTSTPFSLPYPMQRDRWMRSSHRRFQPSPPMVLRPFVGTAFGSDRIATCDPPACRVCPRNLWGS